MGKQYFQELEQLNLRQMNLTTLGDVSAWLVLPKLKMMMVNNLIMDEDLPADRDSLPCDPLIADRQSPIEHLIFLKAIANVDSLAKLLKPLDSLRTFIWQDNMVYFLPLDSSEYDSDSDSDSEDMFVECDRANKLLILDIQDVVKEEVLDGPAIQAREGRHSMDETLTLLIRGQDGLEKTGPIGMDHGELRDYYGNKIAIISQGKTVESIREEFWKTLIEYNSDQVAEDIREEVLQPSFQNRINESRIFKPKILLDHIAHSHSHKLEHLALTVNRYEQPIPLRQHQILDFKDFTKITHLELDMEGIGNKEVISLTFLHNVYRAH